MRLSSLLLPVAGAGAAALLVPPGLLRAFDTNGSSLSTSQRDARVFDDFADAATNNNVTPDSQFPGYTGVEMAAWKSIVEWGSELHGNGNGDPHQPGGLGSGGANFDSSWQGNANGVGGVNDNIISPLAADGGSVYAFAEGPYSDGWRIRFYEDPWIWSDGPTTAGLGGVTVDFQGICAHEYGHALGLNHSTAGGSPTMQASTPSNTSYVQRSIAADDIAGVQDVYGIKDVAKPRITAVAVDVGGVLTITGLNFSGTGNEVWLTQETSGGTGTPVKVTGVSSDGTTITVTAPANAGPGDVLVKKSGTGFATLSNAFPVDPGDTTGGGPGLTVTGFNPASIPALTPDGQTVQILGTGFTDGSGLPVVTGITIGGVALTAFPPQWTVDSDSQMTATVPLLAGVGPQGVVVTTASDNASLDLTIEYATSPTLDLANSDPSFLLNGLGITCRMGGAPGDLAFLCVSTENLPTSVPELFDLAIGNNFASLVYIGVYAVDAVKGYTEVHFPISTPIAFGTHVYFQYANFSASTGFPMPASNMQSGTFLF